jgi:hypothetical protein
MQCMLHRGMVERMWNLEPARPKFKAKSLAFWLGDFFFAHNLTSKFVFSVKREYE